MRRLGLVVFCVLFLLGCQSHALQEASAPGRKESHAYKNQQPQSISKASYDGPPSGPLPTKFKEVSPKEEPLSRYGNPSTYCVHGETYDVLTTAKGYKKRGIASWYGTKFHEKRTSSGEEYDMYALTAAHKTLPLPSYVQVKNLNNGKKIIVKVNDRGPFHEGRIIDLSYAAGIKLGLLPQGTAPVEVKALSLNTQKKIPQAQYYLQAGAFKSEAAARAYRDELLKITPLSHIIVEKHLANQIVKLGPMKNKQQAEQLTSLLKEKGFDGAFSFLE